MPDKHVETPWLGGRLPIEGETYVRIWLRGTKARPATTTLDGYAAIFDWSWHHDEYDIVRYMVLVPASP